MSICVFILLDQVLFHFSSAKRVSKMTGCKKTRAKISHIKEKRNLKKQSVIMGFPIGNRFALDLSIAGAQTCHLLEYDRITTFKR